MCVELSYERDEGVAIAVAVGPLTVKVTVRQNEAEMSPKVEVEGYLGTLHFLLSPHQLGLLQEIAESLVAQGECGWRCVFMCVHVCVLMLSSWFWCV